MKNTRSAKSARRVQRKPKLTAAPARSARPMDRIGPENDLDAKKRAISLMDRITQHYPIRTWAKWTHHQGHGWWTHVRAGEFDQVRFLWRDLDDLEQTWQRCLDERQFDQELLESLDAIEEKQMSLSVAVEAHRNLLRRKSRALFVEQQSGR